MKTSSPLHTRDRPAAFALVITLIMVVLAAIMAVALLSNASLDRTTAKSVDDRYQAELAVQNGLEAAKKALMASPNAASSVTGDDTFLVLRADGTQGPNSSGSKDAYYFLAKARPGAANIVDCYPLFAGGAPTTVSINATSYAVGAPTPPPAFSTAPAQETFGSTTRIYPTLLPFQQPAYTQWQEIRDPNDMATGTNHDLPYQRYTFWMEDLAGYIDASVAGNTNGPGSKHRRPDSAFDPSTPSTYAARYRTAPAELAMFTLLDSTPAADPGTTAAQFLIGSRPLLFTVGTLKQIAPGANNTDITVPILATRLVSDNELPLVPFGYGYVDEGKLSEPKIDINAQVQAGGSAAVLAIATKINNNLLPNFALARQGGLAGQDYVNTIAASMIDYADVDSDATVGTDYRGIDSYPLVSELYSMKWWKRTYPNPPTGTYFVTVEMDTWAELWNMSNQPVSGSFSFQMIENLGLQTGVYPYTFGIEPGDLPYGSSVVTTYPNGQTTPVSLKANEYAVHHIRHDVFEFNTGVPLGGSGLFSPPDPTNGMDLTGSLKTNYNLKWSGIPGTPPAIIVDHAGAQTGIGVARKGGKLRGYGQSTKRWNGSDPGFGYTDTSDRTTSQYETMGDPRSAFFIQSGQVTIDYEDGSSFWERNSRKNIAPSKIYKAVKPSSWPDGGHDSKVIETAPGNTSDPPTAPPPGVTTESTKAPATISNVGSYSTIAEIGNVFDPGLWNVTTDANNRWTDISSAAQSSGKYGGGQHLRIGRPEFTLFDAPGVRAWQLLDLFHTANRVNTRGLVNINTAARDVLRALGAGILLNRDPDVQDSRGAPGVSLKDKLYPPFTSKQADQFADAVIATRPFLSPGQLAGLKTAAATPAAFFGNTDLWPSSPGDRPTEWNNSGTEEYFAKVFPLTTVRSRNFRVFVTGQTLDKSGSVLSTVTKVFQLCIDPTRDATGKITSQNTTTTYEALLPL